MINTQSQKSDGDGLVTLSEVLEAAVTVLGDALCASVWSRH